MSKHTFMSYERIYMYSLLCCYSLYVHVSTRIQSTTQDTCARLAIEHLDKIVHKCKSKLSGKHKTDFEKYYITMKMPKLRSEKLLTNEVPALYHMLMFTISDRPIILVTSRKKWENILLF